MGSTLHAGNSITVTREDDIALFVFDRKDASVNKFDVATIKELQAATRAVAGADVKGVLVSSAKGVFIVGADIMEFSALFGQSEAQVLAWLANCNAGFSGFEDINVPSVVAINGFALGGGLEMCLACDVRVMSSVAKIGLPETNLGLIPGFGGTVRLARLAGARAAVQWVAGARPVAAADALAQGVVDAVAEPDALLETARQHLQACIAGEIDYRVRRAIKLAPIESGQSSDEIFSALRSELADKTDPNYPAAMTGLMAIEQGAALARDEAVRIESGHFKDLTQTDQCRALCGLFVADQALTKKSKGLAKSARAVSQAGVLGAGIMGGGIAYQSAFSGTPILMKDITQDALDLGLSQAGKLLDKRVKRGRMSAQKKAEVLAAITPTLEYDGFSDAQLVIESVVENPAVKRSVLAEIEAVLGEAAIIASNTSTISISHLAEVLQRPQQFCGVHFFNPVHAMPLVEVIRGEHSGEQAINTAVAYALALGKKPVVVNDCPGFLINRVLFPYMQGFSQLVREGVPFSAIDRALEAWGMPMGPAYLNDVVGMDTMVHCMVVMEQGFPARMGRNFIEASQAMMDAGRLGQKSGAGFYDYTRDENGRPTRTITAAAEQVLAPHIEAACDMSDTDIVRRCLLPMATEMALCLEEGIVASAAEADLALVYGLGFPRFRGGILRWMDAAGLPAIAAMSKRYADLGEIYSMTPGMRAMLAQGASYYD